MEDWGRADGSDHFRNGLAKFVDHGIKSSRSQTNGARGGNDETAEGQLDVIGQPLPERDGIQGHVQSVNQCVPSLGLALADGIEITLQETLIFQRTEPFQLLM